MTIEERIATLQKELDNLKEQVKNGKSVFGRVPLNGIYYRVKLIEGKAYAEAESEDDTSMDSNSFANNNYFHSMERAKEVAEKINVLLKLERIYDMLCPNYEPDWNDETVAKCDILTHISEGNILSSSCYGVKSCVGTYFPEDKIEEAIELYKSMK